MIRFGCAVFRIANWYPAVSLPVMTRSPDWTSPSEIALARDGLDMSRAMLTFTFRSPDGSESSNGRVSPGARSRSTWFTTFC
jgi:hypothetical protein